jgi:Tfp pilus assembly protein PilV
MKSKKQVKKLGEQAGFSLLEVVFAMVFLSIGLLATAQMIPAGLAGVTQARVRTNAVQAAQQRLEELRSADFLSADLAAGTYTESNGDYTVQWIITDDAPVPGSKRVDITSTWSTVTGTQTSTLMTYVTRR